MNILNMLDRDWRLESRRFYRETVVVRIATMMNEVLGPLMLR
jgi:hypothetical protein